MAPSSCLTVYAVAPLHVQIREECDCLDQAEFSGVTAIEQSEAQARWRWHYTLELTTSPPRWLH